MSGSSQIDLKCAQTGVRLHVGDTVTVGKGKVHWTVTHTQAPSQKAQLKSQQGGARRWISRHEADHLTLVKTREQIASEERLEARRTRVARADVAKAALVSEMVAEGLVARREEGTLVKEHNGREFMVEMRTFDVTEDR